MMKQTQLLLAFLPSSSLATSFVCVFCQFLIYKPPKNQPQRIWENYPFVYFFIPLFMSSLVVSQEQNKMDFDTYLIVLLLKLLTQLHCIF